MTKALAKIVTDKITGMMVEHGFDEDDVFIQDVIEAVCDIFGLDYEHFITDDGLDYENDEYDKEDTELL